MEEKDIDAIIRLLDDPDVVVYSIIEKKVLEMGSAIIPKLEKHWENSLNEFLHKRVENIIQKIQFTETSSGLIDWKNNESDDLLKGAYLIAKYQYPDLDFNTLHEKIEKLKRDAWIELRDHLTPLEQIRILNYILFEVNKFSGNNSNFYAPQNSYINHVLETKKGNPISLAIIYSVIAQKIGIPVYGVNLPKNFILAYVNKQKTDNLVANNDDILFYVNPFNRGAVLGKREIDYFLKQQKLPQDKIFYKPCDNIVTMQRLLNNLIFSYEKLGYPEKTADIQKLLALLGNPLTDETEWE